MDAATKATIDHALDRLRNTYQRKWDNDPAFRKALKGKDRVIHIDLDVMHYVLTVRDGVLENVVESLDPPNEADVLVRLKANHFVDIYERRLHPMRAWMTRKVHVKAPASDILFVRSLLGL